MPNQPDAGLPNEQKYTVMNIGGDEVVRDEVTGLIWQRQMSVARLSWPDAVTYCEGLTLAGWDDWRLPSRIELVTLLDLTHADPALNQTAFPDVHGEWLWTSTRQADDPTRSWYVYFYFGYPDTDAQYATYLTRCVR